MGDLGDSAWCLFVEQVLENRWSQWDWLLVLLQVIFSEQLSVRTKFTWFQCDVFFDYLLNRRDGITTLRLDDWALPWDYDKTLNGINRGTWWKVMLAMECTNQNLAQSHLGGATVLWVVAWRHAIPGISNFRISVLMSINRVPNTWTDHLRFSNLDWHEPPRKHQ